ncbi:AAA family ATPase [Paenibacillus endoradicis]|uniref:AAA family ATPase n=1 Tax=Paenibacillus endoradicis TaxID=2972487 RepID=UPI0021591D35|nr:AAA family ATPase [Paenibacillus endoradicis]MCR8656420.1 AAA family ATPase [Paenibacillus endoradicis]
MKLIIIFGPQAVGKMTVGQSLAEITNLKLFHNHMTIDLVSNFFDYGSSSGKRLVNLFRQEIFEEVAKSDLEGLIFTFVWGLDLEGDWEYVRQISSLFENENGIVYMVELEADLDTRLERNKSENRLLHKPTKRDMVRSEHDLIKTMKNHRLNSQPDEIQSDHYLKINNTNISPSEVATMIRDTFNL